MNTQIISLKELGEQYRAGLITDDQIIELYGEHTLARLLDKWMELCYAVHYA